MRYATPPYRKSWAAPCLSRLVWLLLFVFGVSIGSDPFVMGNLGNFGGQALLLCLAGMVGSIVFVAAVWRLFFKKGGGL